MEGVGGLVAWLIPLSLLAAISPVVFLNASTVVTHAGLRGGWRFLAGNVAVLVVLGTVGMGLLGATVAQQAEREFASRRIDVLLGVLLVVLAVSMVRGPDRDRHGSTSPEKPSAHPAGAEPGLPRSLIGWGALGMATNLTTVPLYLAMAQRIGAADLPAGEGIALLATVTVAVLAPAWTPMAVRAVAPRRSRLSPQLRDRIAGWTTRGSVIACLAGAFALFGRALLD